MLITESVLGVLTKGVHTALSTGSVTTAGVPDKLSVDAGAGSLLRNSEIDMPGNDADERSSALRSVGATNSEIDMLGGFAAGPTRASADWEKDCHPPAPPLADGLDHTREFAGGAGNHITPGGRLLAIPRFGRPQVPPDNCGKKIIIGPAEQFWTIRRKTSHVFTVTFAPHKLTFT